ncbi:MAG: hypothetical protein SGI73_03245 [Chloroflexota bacterium]|nr:hypothetical protein [Chloroflexota bacterium]
MLNAATSVSINLTQDELVWLLATFRLPPMIGMNERYFPDGLSDQTMQARLASGASSLRARELVSSADTQINVDTLLMGIMGAFAFAQGTVVLTVTTTVPEAPTIWVYYQSAALTIEHTMTAPNVHRFTVVAQAAALTDILMGHLTPLAAYGWSMPPQAVPAQALGEAIQLAKGDPTQDKPSDPASAESRLLAMGMDSYAAAAFVHLMTTQTGGASLAILRRDTAAPSDPTLGTPAERQFSSAQSVILIAAPDATAQLTTWGADDMGVSYSAIAFLTPDELRADLTARLRIDAMREATTA